MKAFGYIRDPLFVVSCGLYVVNRWVLKPYVHSPFLRGHFNDLLLIPCALPPLLLMQRWLRLRATNEMPAAGEIICCLGVWTLLFEWVGPRFIPGTTADPGDALAYAVGALIAYFWWRGSGSCQTGVSDG